MDPTRQATVLFADLSGGTKLYDTVDATRALQAIDRCLELLREATGSGGGRVVKTIGAKIMAIFPAPAAAADAAAAMQAAIDALPEVANIKLGVRIAFHSGPVTLRDGDLLGDTVNLAARLIEQAQKQQIVTSTNTAAALGRAYKDRVRDLHPVQIKGKIEEMGLCEFVWRARRQEQIPGGPVDSPSQRVLRLKYGVTEIVRRWRENSSIGIGRDFECGLVILDDLASRRHGSIGRRGESFILVDHSTNGTYVTEAGEAEILIRGREFTLRKHGWIAFGRPRGGTDQVVEYFCD